MPLLTIDQAKQILNLIIKTKRDFNACITGDNGAEPIVVKCAKRTTIGGA
tara:strand:+ start:413 stop:562 length:150 start_codon:yes stop_codon:yes gene_type:complete